MRDFLIYYSWENGGGDGWYHGCIDAVGCACWLVSVVCSWSLLLLLVVVVDDGGGGGGDGYCCHVGYARVLFAVVAFGMSNWEPFWSVGMYVASFVCDELDGRYARKYGQTSMFGAVLDMVTDRVATCGLVCVLSGRYPRLMPGMVVLMMLDVSSHWFQMYATLSKGSKTHKDVESRSAVVRFYYRHRIFMGFCCVCVEVMYLVLYLLSWEQGESGAAAAAARWLGDYDHQYYYYSCLKVLVLISAPGFVFKQVINVVQLKTAADVLVAMDADLVQ